MAMPSMLSLQMQVSVMMPSWHMHPRARPCFDGLRTLRVIAGSGGRLRLRSPANRGDSDLDRLDA
jgi:hypothetical protein